MGVAMRQDDYIASLKVYRWLTLQARPALSVGDDVVADEVFRAREHGIDDGRTRGGLGYPGFRRLHVEEYGAGEADGSQDIGQGIHASFSGRLITSGGRAVMSLTAPRPYTLLPSPLD
jgi:hypothetical protein